MVKTLLSYIYSGHQWLVSLEKKPRDYGTGELLNPSAIHTLTALDRKPGCNLTQLAEELRISKAAVSKFTSSLAKQRYLLKHVPKKDQGRDVYFTLTDKGIKAVKGHAEFSRTVFGPLLSVEEKLPDNEKEIIRRYLESLVHLIGIPKE